MVYLRARQQLFALQATPRVLPGSVVEFDARLLVDVVQKQFVGCGSQSEEKANKRRPEHRPSKRTLLNLRSDDLESHSSRLSWATLPPFNAKGDGLSSLSSNASFCVPKTHSDLSYDTHLISCTISLVMPKSTTNATPKPAINHTVQSSSDSHALTTA
jgi:hypothetical protein